jgi:hypothetical protein
MPRTSRPMNAKYRKSHSRVVRDGFPDISCGCALSQSVSELGAFINPGQKRTLASRPPSASARPTRELQMRKLSLLLVLLSLAGILASTESFAQSALRGAVIGGAIGGRRGAAIGATAGAVAGAHRRHRRWNNYYWRNGSCWYRSSSGRSHRVSHRYC